MSVPRTISDTSLKGGDLSEIWKLCIAVMRRGRTFREAAEASHSGPGWVASVLMREPFWRRMVRDAVRAGKMRTAKNHKLQHRRPYYTLDLDTRFADAVEIQRSGDPLWVRNDKTRYVYFLFNGERLVYVGMTADPFNRLGSHNGTKDFSGCLMVPVEPAFAAAIEAAFICVYRPMFNRFVPPINPATADALIGRFFKAYPEVEKAIGWPCNQSAEAV